MTTAYLSLGTNLGDREAYLENALRELAAAGVRIVRQSQVLDTAPLGVAEQPRFLNQVVEVETSLSPRELLLTLKAIEASLGRQRRERWGPREIDIDILKYGNQVVDEKDLHIPHPEIGNRPFLGKLLAELGAS